ncbi:Agamous-like MADS-box protein AGL97 [Cardamine amara subsp. amara]|uniref:Agamous-like MADS-box protein AGL97 n=1 Tax=Cardamine amara subsp. amara TaxID=228776 RepID=A0ABD1BQ20_CARAN
MGGMKRKLPMEKIEKKSARAVCFSKRRPGLFTKASEFCLLSGAQMAILTTPPSSESNVSFYSWGHSSVDGVVDSFLKDQRPVREDNIVGCDRWWEDESLAKSDNAEELSGAIDSISRMLSDLKKRNLVLNETQKLDDQTLNNLQSTNFGILDDPEMVVFDDQVLAISETTDNKTTRNLDDGYGNQELDLDQLLKTDTEMVVLDDQVLTISETTDNKPTRNLDDGYGDQELDLDQLIDFGSLLDDDGYGNLELDLDQLLSSLDEDVETTQEQTESNLLMENPNMWSGSEAEAFGLYRGLYEDDFGHDDFEASLLMNSSEMDNDVSFHDDFEASVLMNSSEMDNDVSVGRGLYEDDLSIFNELSNISPL